MILAISLNPSLDRTVFLDELKVGDTNRVDHTETDAGGKGINLARVAAEMGAKTKVLGYVGGGSGDFVIRVLNREGVANEFIEVSGETRTNVCIETSVGGPPTMLNERGPEISSHEWQQLIELVESASSSATWVAVGGSVPPGIPQDCMKTLVEVAHRSGAMVLLDADDTAFALGMQGIPEFIKPNLREAERYIGRAIPDQESALRAAEDLHLAGTHIVVLSRGELGAILACEEGLFNAVPPKIHQRSTIGSGDSLLGAVLAALEQGSTMEEALRWGVAAGAATAMTDGASIGRKTDVLNLLPQVVVERCR